MSQTNTRIRVAGAWLAVGSLLLAVMFPFHGPLAVDMADRMTTIAEGAASWVTVHWVSATALSLFAGAGLLVLTAGSRLTEGSWTTSAWVVLPVGALWTMTTAVAEATAVTGAAVSGNAAIFEAWWSFSEGKANGFAFLALAVAVIAGNEARTSDGATPVWASWVGAVVAAASFLCWVAWSWFGVTAASPVWVAVSLAMCLWLLWFGVALMRTPAAAA